MTTTVRVRNETRDLINELAGRRAQTVDALLNDALKGLAWQQLRQETAERAREIAADPRERAFAQQIMRELDELTGDDD